MKKIITIILITLGSLIVLGIISANIDYGKIKDKKKPILSIYVGKDPVTKADKYYGLGYYITKCPDAKDSEGNIQESEYKLSLFSDDHICFVSFEVDENYHE